MTVTNYPVGDFLIRIKNACLVRKQEISVPKTKLIYEVAKVMKKVGFLSEVKTVKDRLEVKIAYHRKNSLILDLKLVSRPGTRVYYGVDELLAQKGGSTLVVSTSKGVMTGKEAAKKGLGGEVIVEVW